MYGAIIQKVVGWGTEALISKKYGFFENKSIIKPSNELNPHARATYLGTDCHWVEKAFVSQVVMEMSHCQLFHESSTNSSVFH